MRELLKYKDDGCGKCLHVEPWFMRLTPRCASQITTGAEKTNPEDIRALGKRRAPEGCATKTKRHTI